jgi:hypothetical protein
MNPPAIKTALLCIFTAYRWMQFNFPEKLFRFAWPADKG